MRKKLAIRIIVILFVAGLGFASGYYSEDIKNIIAIFYPINENRIHQNEEKQPVVSEQHTNVENKQVSNNFITEIAAIEAIKELPIFAKRLTSPTADTSISFTAEQKPTAENPIWVIEAKEAEGSKSSVITYFKVNAKTGKVLDLSKNECQISAIGLDNSLKEIQKIYGQPMKTQNTKDRRTGRKIKVLYYNGIHISVDRKGKLIEIGTDAPEYEGPRDIKVGMGKEEVIGLLGNPENSEDALLTFKAYDDHKVQFLITIKDDSVSEMTIRSIGK